MNYTIFMFGLILHLSSYHLSTCTNDSDNLKAIEISYTIPISNWDPSRPDSTMLYHVYYYNDIVLYKFPATFLLFNRQELIKAEKMYEYFVRHVDSSFGIMYVQKPLEKVSPGKRMHVDSALGNKVSRINYGDIISGMQPDSIQSFSMDSFAKFYTPLPIDKTDTIPYTESFYYSKKLYGIDESFCKPMDNVPGMKLVRIELKQKKPYRPGFPNKPMIYEMKEIPITNREMILDFFNKYETQYRKK